MKKIKGVDLKDKQMRFFPVLQGIIEVVKTTKKKQGYIKLCLPDEMLNDLMWLSLGMESHTQQEQYLISCRVKNKSCVGCKGEGKKHYNGCFDCYNYSKYEPIKEDDNV